MKKKTIWRLGRLPEPQELVELVKNKLITQDEAREILISSETEEDRDKKSLESEIKFLRDLVEKLSSDKTKVVEVIRTIQKPYYHWEWYRPYHSWCDTIYSTVGTSGNVTANGSLNLGTTVTGGSALSTQTAGMKVGSYHSNNLNNASLVAAKSDFSSIKTF